MTGLNHLMRFLVRMYPFKFGKGRVLSFAMRHVSGMSISTDEFGNDFLLDLRNYIDSRIFLEGSYEKPEILVLSRCIDERDCTYFIDTGANIGVYTILFAAHPKIEKVYAFEPDPRNYLQLLANIFVNQLHNRVTPYNVALSSESGKGLLHLSTEPREFESGKFNTGANSLRFAQERHDSSIEVETCAMDDLIELAGQSVAIKIDVEGHELSVLAGMKRCLHDNNCTLLLEVFADRFDAVNNYLGELGYRRSDTFKLVGSNYIYLKDRAG